MSNKHKLDRNNTNFPKQLFEYLKNVKWDHKYDFLKYYQNLARIFMNDIDIDSKGLLIYHTMGLGKSILAVSIAVDMMKTRQPIILLTKSLQGNMRGAFHKYITMRSNIDPEYELAELDEMSRNQWINQNVSFASMNASNMLKQVKRIADGQGTNEIDTILEKRFGEVLKLSTLNGKLLIVDEAHNLFRSITNGGKNARGLYDMIMKSTNLKIIFLTGTPITSDPFELVPCFNMLSGKQLFPEDYQEFYKLFVDDSQNKLKNKSKFQNRIFGMVSYVSHLSRPGYAIGLDDSNSSINLPEEFPIIVEYVNMDNHQWVIYSLARDKEKDEGSNSFGDRFNHTAAMTKPRSKASSTYRVKSRQLSNYCPPNMFLNEKDPNKLPIESINSTKFRRVYNNIIKHPNTIGLFYSQFVGIGGLAVFAKYLDTLGWKHIILDGVDRNIAEDDINQMDNIYEGGGGNDKYDQFIDHFLNNIKQKLDNISENTWWLSSSLKSSDISCNKAGGDDNTSIGKTYAIISGNVHPDIREKIKNIFNSPENRYGGIIDLIMVSSTGAEGLDLKNIRHIHCLEPYWDWSRFLQIIGRGVRTNSHEDLAPNERNVQPYAYLSIPPESEKMANGTYIQTTDTELYEKSIKQKILTDSGNQMLGEVSIECMINAGENCKVCNPDSRQLFTDNIVRDINMPDPCANMKETNVTAEEIIFENVSYYYTACNQSIYGYKIYVYDSVINSYRSLKETDYRYKKIIEMIENKK